MSVHSIGLSAKTAISLATQKEFVGTSGALLQIGELEILADNLTAAYTKLVEIYTKDSVKDTEMEKFPIPSGSVYLAQLMAHDMIQTVKSGLPGVKFENIVRRPLMLGTIYGRGPDVQPSLYKKARPKPASLQSVPFRPKFRIGTLGKDPITGQKGLDLPRAAEDADKKKSLDSHFTWREAIIADRRNDSHTILAQITAVWMEFHNRVYDQLDQIEDERERFRSAQRIVISSWHKVICNDILPYILKLPRNRSEHKISEFPKARNFVDRITGLPPQESRIAFRCLHCLPLNQYGLGGNRIRQLKDVLAAGSEQSVVSLNSDWIINWRRFFDLSDTERATNRTVYQRAFAKDLTRGSDGTHLLTADMERVLEILATPGGNAAAIVIELRYLSQNLKVNLARLSQGSKFIAAPQSGSGHPNTTHLNPLLLELLEEAETEQGAHLGMMGTLYLRPWLRGALKQADDRISLNVQEQKLVQSHFVEILEFTNQL